MNKILIQGTVTILIFLGIWLALSQIDWITLFKVQKVTDTTEEKLGELYWQVFKQTEEENKNTFVIHTVDSIVSHVCESNNINRESIKVHILNQDIVNAFALPNGHLIVYSGLILNSDNQEELTGVLCHEIAHIELNHVMKKLIKEIGLTVLISMTTGNGGGEIIKETSKLLSSSAFDRNLEKEADLKAVDYLKAAKVDPEPFANFLYKLSDQEHESLKYFTWISTHPDSRERAEYIIEYNKGELIDYDSILDENTWLKLKSELTK